MSECDVMRESLPMLLTESLDPVRRELTHQHIESCGLCSGEWAAYKDTWNILGDMPEVEVPARVKQRFLAAAGIAVQERPSNVVPFHRKPVFKWAAQAAAVVMLLGGGWFAGNRTAPRIDPTPAVVTDLRPIQAQPVAYSIAESRTIAASALSPEIQGRPNITNVHFTDADPSDNQIGVSFDMSSRWTVTGNPKDKSMVRLLSYVLENDGVKSPSSAQAIEWVRRTYSDPAFADPEIADALAKLLRSEEHEGVRIRAVDTLKTLPAMAMASDGREALIEALKSDPNPAVRIKAIEALALMARAGSLDASALDTLRKKANQEDENLYVRVKAAEALSNVRP